MPKFRSKPKIITAEQFRVAHKPWPPNVRAETDVDGGGTYYVVHNNLHESDIRLHDGDYVRVDDLNDTYPIDQSYMGENYTQLAGPFTCPNCNGVQDSELDKCPKCRLRYCSSCISGPCRGSFHQIN